MVDIDVDLKARAAAPDPARGRRLAVAMSLSGCKRAELAHICECSERQITRYRAGDPIPCKIRKIICARCEVSDRYLVIGDAPGLPAGSADTIVLDMTTPQDEHPTDTEGIRADEMLAVNHIPIHRLHINLLRHLRTLPGNQQTAALDRIINNRWAGPLEPFKGGRPVLDGVALDRYEIAAVLALRAIHDVGREVSLINHLLTTRPAGDV